MSETLQVSYLPTPARIVALIEESDDTRTFVLETVNGAAPWQVARPGQFVLLSIFGEGEAAFTISGWDGNDPGHRRIWLTVRRVGRLTSALFALRRGAVLGIRGPFGRGLPTWPASAGVLFVAGGCGLAPLRAAIEHRIATRSGSGRVTIVYGARDPAARIFRSDLDRWHATAGVVVLECVERPDHAWHGHVGNVDQLLDQALRQSPPEFAAACGPPAMMAAVARRLLRAGLSPAHISLAIERQMKCGVGLCGRCYVGHRLACTDGPVFSLEDLAAIDPAFRDETGATAPAQ